MSIYFMIFYSFDTTFSTLSNGLYSDEFTQKNNRFQKFHFLEWFLIKVSLSSCIWALSSVESVLWCPTSDPLTPVLLSSALTSHHQQQLSSHSVTLLQPWPQSGPYTHHTNTDSRARAYRVSHVYNQAATLVSTHSSSELSTFHQKTRILGGLGLNR